MGPGPRPYRMNGAIFNCAVCGAQFYRKRSFIERGITKTCGKSECKSQFFSGSNNPAWGRTVPEEHRQAIRDSNMTRPKKRTGPPLGYKHTPEARSMISAALRERWRLNRDKMIAALTKPKSPDSPRIRREFTTWQKRNWKASVCAWCDCTEGLELDHIIPVVIGGMNIRANAQTLCRKCNLWKMSYVDRPYHLASLASKAAIQAASAKVNR